VDDHHPEKEVTQESEKPAAYPVRTGSGHDVSPDEGSKGMKTLTIDAVGPESAGGLCSALSAFHPQLIEDEDQIRVKVDLTGRNGDIVAILNAIERYVRSRDDGPALLALDGQPYMLEATSSTT